MVSSARRSRGPASWASSIAGRRRAHLGSRGDAPLPRNTSIYTSCAAAQVLFSVVTYRTAGQSVVVNNTLQTLYFKLPASPCLPSRFQVFQLASDRSLATCKRKWAIVSRSTLEALAAAKSAARLVSRFLKTATAPSNSLTNWARLGLSPGGAGGGFSSSSGSSPTGGGRSKLLDNLPHTPGVDPRRGGP